MVLGRGFRVDEGGGFGVWSGEFRVLEERFTVGLGGECVPWEIARVQWPG